MPEFDVNQFLKTASPASPEQETSGAASKQFDVNKFLNPETVESAVTHPFKTVISGAQSLIGAGDKWLHETSKSLDPKLGNRSGHNVMPISPALIKQDMERRRTGEKPIKETGSGLISGPVGFAAGNVSAIPNAVLSGMSFVSDLFDNPEQTIQEYIKNPAKAAVDFSKQLSTDRVGTLKRMSETVKDMDAYDAMHFIGSLMSPVKGPWNKLGKTAIGGIPTEASERSAQVLEVAGMKIEPRQLKPEGTIRTAGYGEANMRNNAERASEILTKDTGVVVKQITPDWITQRLRDVGSQYNKVFSPKKFFRVDKESLEELQNIERFAGASGSTGSPQTAEVIRKILEPYKRMTSANPSFAPPWFEIRGDLLQSLRSGLTEIKNGAEGTEAWQANNAFQSVTGSIARNHPEHAAALSGLDKQYASTMFLRHLDEAGGLKKGIPSLPTASRLYDQLGYRHVEPYAVAKAANDIGLIASWEVPPATDLASLVKHYTRKGAGIATAGMSNLPRTQFSRGIQRFIMKVKSDPKMSGRMTPEAESLLNDIGNLPIDEEGTFMQQPQQLHGPR